MRSCPDTWGMIKSSRTNAALCCSRVGMTFRLSESARTLSMPFEHRTTDTLLSVRGSSSTSMMGRSG